MTIDPVAVQSGVLLRAGGSGSKFDEAQSDGFASILASLDPQLAAEANQSAPAKTRIGSLAHAFIARPLLLDTPAPGSAATGPDDLAQSEAVVYYAHGESLADLVRQVRQLQQTGEAVRQGSANDVLTDLSALSQASRPGSGAQLTRLASAGMATVDRPALRNLLIVPAGMPAPLVSAAQQARGARPGASAAAPAAQRAAAQPFSALLLQGEGGLQLVIRLPELTADVREQLESRITRMFTRRGLPVPQLLITSPEAGIDERTA